MQCSAGNLVPFSLNFLSDTFETQTEASVGKQAGNRGFELVMREKSILYMSLVRELSPFDDPLHQGFLHGRNRMLYQPGSGWLIGRGDHSPRGKKARIEIIVLMN